MSVSSCAATLSSARVVATSAGYALARASVLARAQLRVSRLGGAPVPPEVVARARDAYRT
jgi:hypothetical protein